MNTLQRTSSTRSTAAIFLIAVILVMLSIAILSGDLVLFVSVLLLGAFLAIMAYSPENLINAYMWITFLLLLYQYFTRGGQIFALNSLKDVLLVLLWFYLFIQGVINRGKGIFLELGGTCGPRTCNTKPKGE